MWNGRLQRIRNPLILLGAVLLAACSNREMYDQPRYDPLEPSALFADSQSARHPAEGAVSRGYLSLEEWMPAFAGREPEPGRPAPRIDRATDTFPLPVTRELLSRGRERYMIYCTPCHGALGDGMGMITRHGFPQPPSFHLSRLLEAPYSHYYTVITKGFGRMYPYAYRVAPPDRWAIIAYIRALQLSRNARVSDLPPVERARLEALP